MASFSKILTGEEEEEDLTTTHSNRRRWSTPIESNGDKSLAINSNHENRGACGGVNLHEFFSCSSDNSYSFYLGGGDIVSPWGPSGPPLLTGSRSNAPPPQRVEERSLNNNRKKDLPPYLTTLDCNGRPRFNHRRVRSDGRLEIASVAVDLPEIVSVRGTHGLRIGTVRISQQNDDVEEQQEDDNEQQNH
ncbi:unnamed protein product [Cochlearia groenlandica]